MTFESNRKKIVASVFEVRYAAEKALVTLSEVAEFVTEKTIAGLEIIGEAWGAADELEEEYQEWKATKEAK